MNTIDDIVNEMRGNAEHNHALVDVSKYLTEIADRIEEAVKRERGAAEMSAQIEGLRRRIGDLQGEIKTLKAKIAGQRAAIREKKAEIMRVSMRTPDTNFDRFAFMPEMEHGAQISTAFSFYLEEQYPPKLRGAVCMDRAYYDFLLWLFRAPGQKGVAK